jgi:hypothetical protein
MYSTGFLSLVQFNLVGQYSIANAGSFQIGQRFGLDLSKNVRGLRIADETELNSPMLTGDPNAIICPKSVLAKMTISLYNFEKNYMAIQNLPLLALQIDGATEIKANSYYDIGFPIDWTKSFINVCVGTPQPTPNYYVLSIQNYF